MTKMIRPKPEPSFFIGWSPDTPKLDRRFLLGASLGLIAGGGAAAWGLAGAQEPPGTGVWNQGDILDIDGFVTADPYPLIRTTQFGGGVKTALLACMTKCGVRDRLERLSGTAARIRGSLIERGPHRMIAVVDGEDWLEPTLARLPAEFTGTESRSLGSVRLRGEILDTKCWFGAMRPADGKVHKACASLCIRSGLPPAMFARDAAGNKRALVMTTPDGGPVAPTESFLAMVADPVAVEGEIVLLGDLPTFRVNPDVITRT